MLVCVLVCVLGCVLACVLGCVLVAVPFWGASCRVWWMLTTTRHEEIVAKHDKRREKKAEGSNRSSSNQQPPTRSSHNRAFFPFRHSPSLSFFLSFSLIVVQFQQQLQQQQHYLPLNCIEFTMSMSLSNKSRMYHTAPIKEDEEYDSDGAVTEGDYSAENPAAGTSSSTTSSADSAGSSSHQREGSRRSSALLDKKRGLGKHKHAWTAKEDFEEDDDDLLSLAGMISLGDVSTGTTKSAHIPVGMFSKSGASASGKTVESERRKSITSTSSSSSSRDSPSALRLKQLDKDDDGATPMLPPRRKNLPASKRRGTDDAGDDVMVAPFSSRRSGGSESDKDDEQVAGESSIASPGGARDKTILSTSLKLPDDAVYTKAVLDGTDGLYKTEVMSRADESDGIWVQRVSLTQNLHHDPPPGLAARSQQPPSFWATICPC